MKQATFVVEILIEDKKELILVRDPRTGQVVKSCQSPSELASFLSEIIVSAKIEDSAKTPSK